MGIYVYEVPYRHLIHRSSTSIPMLSQRYLAERHKTRVLRHNRSDVFRGHMAQVETCDCNKMHQYHIKCHIMCLLGPPGALLKLD